MSKRLLARANEILAKYGTVSKHGTESSDIDTSFGVPVEKSIVDRFRNNVARIYGNFNEVLRFMTGFTGDEYSLQRPNEFYRGHSEGVSEKDLGSFERKYQKILRVAPALKDMNKRLENLTNNLDSIPLKNIVDNSYWLIKHSNIIRAEMKIMAASGKLNQHEVDRTDKALMTLCNELWKNIKNILANLRIIKSRYGFGRDPTMPFVGNPARKGFEYREQMGERFRPDTPKWQEYDKLLKEMPNERSFDTQRNWSKNKEYQRWKSNPLPDSFDEFLANLQNPKPKSNEEE